MGDTPIGCVMVYENKVVGSGMNDTNCSMNAFSSDVMFYFHIVESNAQYQLSNSLDSACGVHCNSTSPPNLCQISTAINRFPQMQGLSNSNSSQTRCRTRSRIF